MKRVTNTVIAAAFIGLAFSRGVSEKRTDFSVWGKHSYPNAGVAFEMPADARTTGDSDSGFLIQLHRLPIEAGVVGDTPYAATIDIRRVEVAEMTQNLRDLEESRERTNETDFLFWYAGRHPEVSVLDRDQYVHYGYDVDCGDGKVVTVRARILEPLGNNLERAQDDTAIRRILQSVECTN